MRRQLFSTLTATTLLITSAWMISPVRAQMNCDTNANSSFEDVYCDAKTFVKADDDLNVAYQKLVKKLRPADQAVLRQTQRAWIEKRNKEATGTDSKVGTVIYLSAALKMTTERTNFLNDRYRECLSSGCQPSKLK